MIALRQTVHNRNDEIEEHQRQHIFENLRNDCIRLLWRFIGRTMQTFLLILQKRLEWILQVLTNQRYHAECADSPFQQCVTEYYDHEQFLQVNFNERFADQSCTEECPKRHQEMAAHHADCVKQWIGKLLGRKKDET